MEDDPVAAVRRMLALPPSSSQAAEFLGNLTALNATPGNAFMMARQTNCSLTAFNTGYTLSASSATYNAASTTPNFELQIHSAAGLTTTADQFHSGCASSGIGVASNSLIYVGKTSTGIRVGALAAYDSSVQHNVIYLLVTKADGTLVDTPILPDPSSGATNPVGLIAADLNKDGIIDLICVNAVAGGAVSITAYLGNTDGSFQAGQTFAVPGQGALGGVVDDFDGDGNLDVVVPSLSGSTNQVTFLPGKGDGTFSAAKTTTLAGAAAGAQGLVSGDFNGDGKKDLVSAYGLVLMGKGDGTFTPSNQPAFAKLSTSFTGPPPLAAGDFNKDGKLDIAAGTGSSILIALGNGDGTFKSPTVYASISNHGYLAVSDLDGDGNPDIYSGTAGGGIFGGDSFNPSSGFALMGSGDGFFRGAPRAQSAAPQALEDLNGDGKLDYVALSESTNTSSFQTFLGHGDGTFTAGSAVTVSPVTYNGTSMSFSGIDSYTLVDVNNDGRLDLVVLPVQNPGLTYGFEVALGNADGSFQTPTFTLFPSLVVGGGADTIWQVTGLSSSKRSDGKTELLYGYLTGSHAAPYPFYQGLATQVINGDGTFAAPVLTITQTYANSSQTTGVPAQLNVLDVNGDKNPDLIYYATSGTSASLQLVLGNADGTFQSAKSIQVVDNVDDNPVTSADVNNDGKLDLIALGLGTQHYEIGVALGNGDGTFLTPKIIAIDGGYGLESLAAADFDGDGKVDIAILGSDPPYDSGVFLGNGDGTFQSTPGPDDNGGVIPLQPLYLAEAGSAFVADVNGDGKPDIAGSVFLINQYGSSTVAPVASSTVLTVSSSTVTVGQTVTFTATVSATSGSSTPTGTVTFLNGTSTLGTGTVNAQGAASFSTSALTAGSYSITASYGGDSNFSGSTSNAVSVTVNPLVTRVGTTTALTASADAITSGQTVTLTTTVTPNSGTGVPTGTVTFANGSQNFGTGTLNAQGVATFATSSLPVGTQTITANYGGNTNFTASVSNSVSIVVSTPVAADFSVSLMPASDTVNQHGTVQTTLTVTPSGGFTDSTVFTCSGLPKNATCTFNPSSVTPDGTHAATTVLTIQTGVSIAKAEQFPFPGQTSGNPVSLAALGGGGLLGLLILRSRLRARRWWPVQLGVVLVLLASCALVGCGNSSHTTPQGKSQITITGTSGATTHSVTFSLTVQ